MTGGIVAAAVVAELTLRLLGLGYGNVHMEPSELLHHAHPRDHRFVSYHRSGEYGGHVVYYDEAGRRADPSPRAAEAASTRTIVAFMGDSFVEALQVSFEQSFVGRLDRMSEGRATIYNYGTSSYSPALYLLQWRHRVQHISPTHVFVMLFGNDVRDDAEMTEIAERGPGGEILSVSGRPDSSLARLARSTYLGRLIRKVQLQLAWQWEHRGEAAEGARFAFVEENPELSTLTRRYLRTLVEEVRDAGATVVLTAVPSRAQTLSGGEGNRHPTFHDHVRVWAEKHGVPFVDLAQAFEAAEATEPLFFARDIHFTAAGHRVVAEALAAAYPEVFGG